MDDMRFIRNSALIVGFVLVAIGTFGTLSVHAVESSGQLSNEHKQRIVANCTAAKASLERLHKSDASLRVNRGQLYEYISTKLMTRLNSRVVLNRLDGAELVAAAASYERSLRQFRQNYQAYETNLSKVLRTNCATQPEDFYYGVLDARTKRAAVSESVQALHTHMGEYRDAFTVFSSEYKRALRDVSNE